MDLMNLPRRVVLGTVGAVTGSRLAGEVVDRVLASTLVERAARQALAGPLPVAIVHDVVEYRIVERTAEELIQSRVLDDVLESALLDEVLDRLLESDSFWRVVDRVAQSPSVTAAISEQSRSFADEIAGEVRGRSVRADDWLERRTRRILRRDARNGDG